MALFLGKFLNKIDGKGRVSVPAGFRDELAAQNFKGIVAYPSLKNDAIEAGGIDWFEDQSERRDAYAGMSDEYDAFAALFNEACKLPFDGEGRVILPEALLAHAQITETALFAANGRNFEIWQPDRFAARQRERIALRRDRGLTLPARLPLNTEDGR